MPVGSDINTTICNATKKSNDAIEGTMSDSLTSGPVASYTM